MTDLMSIVLVTILAYLATNMDNVALLIALFARFRGRAVFVFAGHLLAVSVILLLAALAGEAANFVELRYLGYLGIMPLALGSYWLYRSIRPASPGAAEPEDTAGGKSLAATFMTLVANSVDTFLTLTVLFADTRQDLDLAIGTAVFATAILLGLGASYAVSRPSLGAATEWFSRRVAPLVMIGVGLYVLADTVTDVL
jgi:cadmium resistance protein CadD (predicted permease)